MPPVGRAFDVCDPTYCTVNGILAAGTGMDHLTRPGPPTAPVHLHGPAPPVNPDEVAS
jgi:hypothetical protein